MLTHLGTLDITESQLVSLTLAMFALLMWMRLRRAAALAAPAAAAQPDAVPAASMPADASPPAAPHQP